MFKALVLNKQDDRVTAAVEEVDEARLPEGDVTVAVEHSTLNYKDGLIILNKAPLVRSFPHVPGIDFAGRVVDSAHPDWRPGDAVVLTGWGVGERQWGGHAERARVKGDWLVPLPAGWTTEHAMAVGTAGFTAMLAVMALESHGLEAGAGEVLVTGAAGGVGSVAVAVLARLGHRVTASTGRAASHDYLKSLGASQRDRPGRAGRAEFAAPGVRALRRLHRQRRGHHARPGAWPDEIPLLGRRGRPRGRQRAPHHGDSVPAAWGQPARDRFGLPAVAPRRPRGSAWRATSISGCSRR